MSECGVGEGTLVANVPAIINVQDVCPSSRRVSSHEWPPPTASSRRAAPSLSCNLASVRSAAVSCQSSIRSATCCQRPRLPADANAASSSWKKVIRSPASNRASQAKAEGSVQPLISGKTEGVTTYSALASFSSGISITSWYRLIIALVRNFSFTDPKIGRLDLHLL